MAGVALGLLGLSALLIRSPSGYESGSQAVEQSAGSVRRQASLGSDSDPGGSELANDPIPVHRERVTVEAPVEEAGRIDVVVRVHDDRGWPLEGVDVVAELTDPDEERLLTRADRKALTDWRGSARLFLFDAPFLISANRRNFRPNHMSVTEPIQVSAENHEVHLVLDRSSTVRVTLRDDAGNPVSPATVHVDPGGAEAAIRQDGIAEVPDLRPGEHVVWLDRAPSGWRIVEPRWQKVRSRPGTLVDVSFHAIRCGTVRIRPRVPPGETASGVVLIAPTGKRSLPRDSEYLEGNGEIELKLAAGSYRAITRTEADSVLGQASPVTFTVRPGQITVADLPLVRFGGQLSGQVVDPQGAPLSGIILQLTPDGCIGDRLFITEADGRFEVRGLPVGRLDLDVSDWDNWWEVELASLVVTVPADELTIQVEREPLRTVAGRLIAEQATASDTPKMVALCREDPHRPGIWDGSRTARVYADRFVFRALPVGAYSIHLGRVPHPGREPEARLLITRNSAPVISVDVEVP